MGSIQTGTTTLGQNRIKSNGNEEVIHITPSLEHYYRMQLCVISRSLNDFNYNEH